MTPRGDTPRVLVVGGHARNIGKSALIVDILRAFPTAAWTAVKITQFGHGECSAGDRGCDCAPRDHAFALDQERDADTGTDTSRFLAAGASRSFWLRTKQGQLALGLPSLREIMAGGANVILESNSVLQFIRPAMYLVVLDPAITDFKETCRANLDRADAYVLRHRGPESVTARSAGIEIFSSWKGVSSRLIQQRPGFSYEVGEEPPRSLITFIRTRFFNDRVGSDRTLGESTE